jgi:hypothetical protein
MEPELLQEWATGGTFGTNGKSFDFMLLMHQSSASNAPGIFIWMI